MKKLLLAGAALALIASPAAAQEFDWSSVDYGNDGEAHWALNARVNNFCKLSSDVDVTASSNVVVTPGDNGRGGSSDNGDGTMAFDIQNDDTNTIQAARG